ncbi:MAG TPA: zinc-binding alcohol dehydrogenase family protein [Gemmatimonadaceae bacterium]|nr:zinc-binding alcohol dehydrogenase family protein [Gemmatimonadaceae bacterium]
MHTLAIFGTQGDPVPPRSNASMVVVDGVRVRCGLVDTPCPDFDAADSANAGKVLVRVTAVSCNYRDKAFFYAMQRVPYPRFTGVGSEFAGVVVAVGPDVHRLRVGDRVVCDQHYDGQLFHPNGVRQGVVANQASRAYHVLPERKLQRIPPTMSDAAAAAFTLGAQTAYSMVRRAGVDSSSRVLVTAGGSNTSLFLLGAVRGTGASVTASTTSVRTAERLAALGIHDVVLAERTPGGRAGAEAIVAAAQERDGFDVVFDPFFDLHLLPAIQALRPGGRYVTCGFAGQNPNSAAAAGAEGTVPLVPMLAAVMQKNLSIIGNCIGLTSDLERALHDFTAGRIAPVIDSVFTEAAAAQFFDRTYNDPDRFGKVVYRYDA